MAVRQAAVWLLNNTCKQHDASQLWSTATALTTLRHKVFTSNVMDDARDQRIKQHFQYNSAKKAWKLQMHKLLVEWRAEQNLKDLHQQEVRQQQELLAFAKEKVDREAFLADKRVEALQEDIRKAELEVEVAALRLQRAQRVQQKRERMAMANAIRQQRLLEASRHWIGREDLVDRINHALDNPQSFGFIVNLPKGQQI